MKDLFFNSEYGDLIFDNDFKYVKDIDYYLNIVRERLKTNVNDFRLQPTSGTDLERFNGSGIDKKLLTSMKTAIEYSLTFDNFLNIEDIEVLIIQTENNSVYIRVILTTPYGNASTDLTYTTE